MAEGGRVTEILRYPVKSMQGETLDRVHLGARGLDGDRAYALFDNESGFVVSAKRPKRWGDVLRCTARSSSGETESSCLPARSTGSTIRRFSSPSRRSSVDRCHSSIGLPT